MANYNSTGVNSDFYSTLVTSGYVYGGSILSYDHDLSNLDLQGKASSGGINTFTPNMSSSSTTFYLQRIYDLTLNKYVYYKLITKTSTPDTAVTTPNHSGNLLAISHEVISTITDIQNI
jgi:hypothetical protein